MKKNKEKVNRYKAKEVPIYPKYIYVLIPRNRKDMQKLYECFNAIRCLKTVCEKGEDYYVLVQTENELDNIRELIEKVDVASVKKYEYTDSWTDFPWERIDRYHRNLLFSRLVDINQETSGPWTKILVFSILAALCIAAYAVFNKNYKLCLVSAVLVLCGILFKILGPRLTKYGKQRREARDSWRLAYLDVIATDTIVHRGPKGQENEERVFMLGDDTRAINHIFSGNDFKIGDGAILFYKKNLKKLDDEIVEFDEDGYQYNPYNGKHIVIPSNYIISEDNKALIAKYELVLNKKEKEEK